MKEKKPVWTFEKVVQGVGAVHRSSKTFVKQTA
jgi:hypothetical protein